MFIPLPGGAAVCNLTLTGADCASRSAARGRPLLASGLQLLGVFCFVGVVFTSGLVIGVKFFHAHEGAMLDAGGLHSFTHNTLEASPHLRGQAGTEAAAPTPGSPQTRGSRPHSAPVAPGAAPGGATEAQRGQPAGDRVSSPPPATTPPSPPPESVADFASSLSGSPAATHPALRAVSTSGAPTRGTALSGGGFVTLPEPYDGHAVTVTAWIRLNGANKDAQMKTVVANRWAGCSADAGRYGFALYVNDWGTSNRQLRVVLGNTENGCVAVFTQPGVIPYDVWTHVAVSLGPPGPKSPVALFVNGKRTAGGVHAREAQATDSLRVGTHSDGEAGFEGSVSAVAVYGAERTEEQIRTEVARGVPDKDPALKAHFPLDGLASALKPSPPPPPPTLPRPPHEHPLWQASTRRRTRRWEAAAARSWHGTTPITTSSWLSTQSPRHRCPPQPALLRLRAAVRAIKPTEWTFPSTRLRRGRGITRRFRRSSEPSPTSAFLAVHTHTHTHTEIE